MEVTAETTRDRTARPLVIAHRGASAEAPENTIAAFELAIAHGADGIALEVHLSKDDQPVVIHDLTLDRTTDGVGPVRDRTVRELKRLDAGGWRGRAFEGQRIQTLQETLERFRDRARFWIELTSGFDPDRGLEEKVVSMLEIYDVLHQALLLSFDHAVLDRVRRLNSEIPLGLLAAHRTGPWPLATLVSAVCPALELVTEQEIHDIRRAGLDCYVWTVNEPIHADRLVHWGAGGIITDRPGPVRDKLGS
ncbi:MAG TPA: glycerophosphodiester phosphodiesterase family protein [Candidatus Methylomirabilis sp.]|nr:glycerophosphodiester phosphodiesterase family protein [Candidatus Methylomirabilis sp.]